MNTRGLYMKYFVLNPSKTDSYGEASRDAILAYAHSIEPFNAELAKDLREWVAALEERENVD